MTRASEGETLEDPSTPLEKLKLKEVDTLSLRVTDEHPNDSLNLNYQDKQHTGPDSPTSTVLSTVGPIGMNTRTPVPEYTSCVRMTDKRLT